MLAEPLLRVVVLDHSTTKNKNEFSTPFLSLMLNSWYKKICTLINQNVIDELSGISVVVLS